MIEFRKAEDIYHKQGGWFEARWHFSFDRKVIFRMGQQLGCTIY
jgi:hypothetical protein